MPYIERVVLSHQLVKNKFNRGAILILRQFSLHNKVLYVNNLSKRINKTSYASNCRTHQGFCLGGIPNIESSSLLFSSGY
jgi:hypothetical protein